MTNIPTAPDVKTEVADRIRSHRKRRDNGGKWFTPNVKDRDEAGRFTTAGGALITVEALVDFSEKYVYSEGQAPSDEHRVKVAAVAKCHGNGCTSPDFRQNDTGYFLLDADPDVTAEAVLPYVHKAREWAQAHAEKCRAQAYSG